MAKVVNVNMDVVFNRGGRVFVISDLHGNIEDFSRWLKMVDFNDNDLCIINGDVIDRGPYGFGLLNVVIDNPNFLFLMGNHEELMLSALEERRENGPIAPQGHKEYLWFRNGGDHTYEDMKNYPEWAREHILDRVKNAPYVARLMSACIQDIYVCHAGLTSAWLNEVQTGYLSKDEYGMSNITWARHEWWNTPNDLGCMTITGHTSSHHYNGVYGEPIYENHNRRIVIDCNTIRSHKVGYVSIMPNSIKYGAY